jgi:hypothetical protein
MVFFMEGSLWGDMETLCRAEAVVVVMLSGDFGEVPGKITLWDDGFEQFRCHGR